MYIEERRREARKRAVKAQIGVTFGDEGIFRVSPEAEARVFSLPCDTTHRRSLQDPATGKPYYMMGVDPLT